MITGVGEVSQGRAFIEGGRKYQQREDNYSDLIDELLFEEKPEPAQSISESLIADKKTQIKSELREV